MLLSYLVQLSLCGAVAVSFQAEPTLSNDPFPFGCLLNLFFQGLYDIFLRSHRIVRLYVLDGGMWRLVANLVWVAVQSMWTWASMKPGTTVFPSRSMDFVSGPIKDLTSAQDPTPMILPSLIAMASTIVSFESTVTIFPLNKIRSSSAPILDESMLNCPFLIFSYNDVVKLRRYIKPPLNTFRCCHIIQVFSGNITRILYLVFKACWEIGTVAFF